MNPKDFSETSDGLKVFLIVQHLLATYYGLLISNARY